MTLGKHWICTDSPYKYYCNFPFLKKSETVLSVWHNSSRGLKFLGNVYGLCQTFGLIMLTIHKLLRLVCPSRLKYWCYFRWVLGYKDYHLICKEKDLGKHTWLFFPLANAWVNLTPEATGHKLLHWLPRKREMHDPESSREPGVKS